MRAKTPKPDQPLDVDSLLKQGDTGAANRLSVIGAGTGPEAKAARRALYLLKQQGVVPDAAPQPEKAAPPQKAEVKAYLTNVTGSAGQLVFFEEADPFGGAPLFHFFKVSYSTGLDEVATTRMPRREIPGMLERLKRGESGLVVEAPADYARGLVKQAAERNQKLGGRLPQGYAESTRRIGPAETEHARPLIYDLVDAEKLADDLSFSRDPETFFQSVTFRSWFMASRSVAEWEEKYFEAVQNKFAVDQAQRESLGDRVIADAADAILDADTQWVLKRSLEEQAAVLQLGGKTEEAKQALHHAIGIDPEKPARDNPFLLYYIKRSIYVIMAYKAEQEPERQGEESVEAEPGPLIERV